MSARARRRRSSGCVESQRYSKHVHSRKVLEHRHYLLLGGVRTGRSDFSSVIASEGPYPSRSGRVSFSPLRGVTANGIDTGRVLPSSSSVAVDDDYSRIREEIVASGLRMLSDDEVRNEIRERRGVRGDTEP